MNRTYGYNDKELVNIPEKVKFGKIIAVLFAITLIILVWFFLNQKLLFGESWLSPTYDNPDWRTNEGNLRTYGMWDLEAHIWKTEYIIENFPNFHWNPYWYMGMPLLKYYQAGFYIMHALVIYLTGFNAARSAILLLIFSHLIATVMTFLLCYKISRKAFASALASIFVLSNTFISLRSYGWEPITVVFLALYPLGLLVFLKDPMRPFRFWMIIVLTLSYFSHPLLFFSLCMTMGVYLFSIAIRTQEKSTTNHYIWHYLAAVIVALLIGFVQFLPQISYHQVTSGAHMGVTYLPFYQVPPNIITIQDFFFDAGNLKGPGPIIMISLFLIIIFGYINYRHRHESRRRMFSDHEMIGGLALSLAAMVLFYYLELFNIFPMNILRSIQYHRIIPEFIITAAALIAALSNITYSFRHKLVYYTMLVAFAIASLIIVFVIQSHWQTSDSISNNEEFIRDNITGRISMPYTDQSLAVRNSFTKQYQVYGYYEQGITNPYADDIFSVSSGFHNANTTILYLKAANVERLYVNMEEGERDRITFLRMNNSAQFVHNEGDRYGYFIIPLDDPSLVQAVDYNAAQIIKDLEPDCREVYREVYCGSEREEFVSTDKEEQEYLQEYVSLIESPYFSKAAVNVKDPHHYDISVTDASKDTGIVVKMTYDKDFSAYVNGEEAPVETFGPYFMIIYPNKEGNYEINLEYNVNNSFILRLIVSLGTLILLSIYFITKPFRKLSERTFTLHKGDMK